MAYLRTCMASFLATKTRIRRYIDLQNQIEQVLDNIQKIRFIFSKVSQNCKIKKLATFDLGFQTNCRQQTLNEQRDFNNESQKFHSLKTKAHFVLFYFIQILIIHPFFIKLIKKKFYLNSLFANIQLYLKFRKSNKVH